MDSHGDLRTDVTLRTTRAADEEFLWLVLFYASHSNDEAGVEPSDVKSNPDLTGYISGWHAAGRVGVIAEADGVGIGAAWLRMQGGDGSGGAVFGDPDMPELAVAVLPGYESRGLGTAMMARLIDDARARFPGIVLSSRADNPAVRLYERLGFEIVGTITNRVGTESVKMRIRF
jgi:ribosomal protein S18 acetylase RimI-like enzyme